MNTRFAVISFLLEPFVVVIIPSKVRLPGGDPSPPRERVFKTLDCSIRIDSAARCVWADIPQLPISLRIYGPDDFLAAAGDTAAQFEERIRQILGNNPAAVLQSLADGIQPPMPKRVPREIPNWRAKAMLAKLGMLETVEQAIAGIPEPQRTVVMLAWNGDAKLARNGQTVLSLAASLGLSSEQLDEIFIEADSLNI